MTYDDDPSQPGSRSTARLSAAMVWMLILVGAFVVAGLAAYSTRDNTSQSTVSGPKPEQPSTTGKGTNQSPPPR